MSQTDRKEVEETETATGYRYTLVALPNEPFGGSERTHPSAAASQYTPNRHGIIAACGYQETQTIGQLRLLRHRRAMRLHRREE